MNVVGAGIPSGYVAGQTPGLLLHSTNLATLPYTFTAGPHAGETHDVVIVAGSDNTDPQRKPPSSSGQQEHTEEIDPEKLEEAEKAKIELERRQREQERDRKDRGPDRDPGDRGR